MHNRTLNALQCLKQTFSQQENAAATYTVNWGAFLDTDTISTSTWSSEDSGVTIANTATASGPESATARISGDVGAYRVVNKIVTAAGDTHERLLDIIIKDNSSGYVDDYGFPE